MQVHTTGRCPVCKQGNIGFFTDKVGTLRQCWDCGSEWNDMMEITIEGDMMANAFTSDREKTEEWTIVDKSKSPTKTTKFKFTIKDIEEEE